MSAYCKQKIRTIYIYYVEYMRPFFVGRVQRSWKLVQFTTLISDSLLSRMLKVDVQNVDFSDPPFHDEIQIYDGELQPDIDMLPLPIEVVDDDDDDDDDQMIEAVAMVLVVVTMVMALTTRLLL